MGHVITINGHDITDQRDDRRRAERLAAARRQAAHIRGHRPRSAADLSQKHFQHLWLVEILIDLCDYTRDQRLDEAHGQLLDALETLVPAEH